MKNPKLLQYGISSNASVYANPTYEELYQLETSPSNKGLECCTATNTGAVAVTTGKYTGRAPNDRYIVKDELTCDTIWWDGDINKSIGDDIWNHCKEIVINRLSQSSSLFIIDAFCGTNADTRMKVRFITEIAWQAHFVTNMFVRPTEFELTHFGEPDFVVLNSSEAVNPQWREQGLHSEIFILFNLTAKMQIIGGTWYGGEMKKGIFSMMNYYLPLRGIASMHCSANVGENGESALFFGLSGTGKTTLSADPQRYLIGDDEHGWDEKGVFNLEGGCYAKTLHLKKEKEPEIWRAIRRDALLENVTVDLDGQVDFFDDSITQNSRVSYPIYFINKITLPSKAGHPKKIVFLTADASGVLPQVACLDYQQAQYYFLCGYTSKVAGTEQGILHPQPSFSPCFGAAFLTLHPTVYADILSKKMKLHQSKAYLVNTGWDANGKRFSLADTRKIIDAILDGSIENAPKQNLTYFNLNIPLSINNIDSAILDPRNSYSTPQVWEERAIVLASEFVSYFKQYESTPVGRELIASGPHAG